VLNLNIPARGDGGGGGGGNGGCGGILAARKLLQVMVGGWRPRIPRAGFIGGWWRFKVEGELAVGAAKLLVVAGNSRCPVLERTIQLALGR
jgi:hypothetical protein